MNILKQFQFQYQVPSCLSLYFNSFSLFHTRCTTYNSIKYKVSSELSVPSWIKRPVKDNSVTSCIKTPNEISRIRKACQITANIRKIAGKYLKKDITTDELDKVCHQEIIKYGAYPACLGYEGFPKSISTSVNDIVLHGIPNNRSLREGDVVGVDLSVFFDGMHGDCCSTFIIGQANDSIKEFVSVAKKCLKVGIKSVQPGVPISFIGKNIEKYAKYKKVSIVKDYCGHCIGKYMHEYPLIPPIDNNQGMLLQPGMVFTIEPAVNMGDADVYTADDGWSVLTVDGQISAQFEETVLVTENGVEILTVPTI